MAVYVAIESRGCGKARDFCVDMTLHLRVLREPGSCGKPLVAIKHHFLPGAPNVHGFLTTGAIQSLYGQPAKGFRLWLFVMEPVDYLFCGLFILPGTGACNDQPYWN